VAVSDDAAGLAARMGGEGGHPAMAVVTTHGPSTTVQRGTPAALAASPVIGPGVVVVGAVAEAEGEGTGG
jgi:hypothetical protein